MTRGLFKDFFEFTPEFKLVLSGNHKPEISGVDHGIWRRMNLVLWPVKITKAEKRPMSEVMSELLPERPGILNWLIEGALEYLNHGLRPPQEVIDATAAYREEMDPVGAFVEMCVERTVPDGTGNCTFVAARAMYDAFHAWAFANSVRAWKEKSFAIAMIEKGFAKEKHRDGMRYLNIRLKNVPESQHSRRQHQGAGEDSDIVPV